MMLIKPERDEVNQIESKQRGCDNVRQARGVVTQESGGIVEFHCQVGRRVRLAGEIASVSQYT